jgi:hypothetical protein
MMLSQIPVVSTDVVDFWVTKYSRLNGKFILNERNFHRVIELEAEIYRRYI